MIRHSRGMDKDWSLCHSRPASAGLTPSGYQPSVFNLFKKRIEIKKIASIFKHMFFKVHYLFVKLQFRKRSVSELVS